MDAELTLITELYEAIKGVIPELDVYLVEAPEDASLPCIVHSMSIKANPDDLVIMPASYQIDIWDANTNAQRIYSYREKLFKLLHHQLVTDSALTVGMRLFLANGQLLPTGERDIYRYQLNFEARIISSQELEDIRCRATI